MEYLYVTDRSVAFMFVNSVAGTFDVPPYKAELAPDGSVVLSFRGASTRNPDGTASYHGPNRVVAANPIEDVSLVEDADRSMRWRIALHEPICPRVAPLRYWTGSYSKALVIVTFGSVSTVTLEPVARPAKAPIWVNGSGFGPQRPVKLTAGGELLRETNADRSGMFSTAIFVPEVAPGAYVVLAEDDVGHRAEATLTVTPGNWP
jgi:hypothetical protein